MRPDYDGRLDTPPASTQGCSAWQALDGAPISRTKRSPGERRFLGSGERGKIISPSFSSSSPSSSPEDSNLEGLFPPPPHVYGSLGNALEPFFLFLQALPFIFTTVGLPPRHILMQDDPPRATMHTSKTQWHERSRRQKGRNRHNQVEISPSVLTQRLATLSLKGTGPKQECRFTPRARIHWIRYRPQHLPTCLRGSSQSSWALDTSTLSPPFTRVTGRDGR
jgi:hypothetical protein